MDKEMSRGDTMLISIDAPTEYLEAYKTATNWSDYADNIFEEPTT